MVVNEDPERVVKIENIEIPLTEKTTQELSNSIGVQYLDDEQLDSLTQYVINMKLDELSVFQNETARQKLIAEMRVPRSFYFSLQTEDTEYRVGVGYAQPADRHGEYVVMIHPEAGLDNFLGFVALRTNGKAANIYTALHHRVDKELRRIEKDFVQEQRNELSIVLSAYANRTNDDSDESPIIE